MTKRLTTVLPRDFRWWRTPPESSKIMRVGPVTHKIMEDAWKEISSNRTNSTTGK